MSQIRYASVCSGVEAASLAWETLGWKPVFFSEIDPFPCEVLRQRFPDVPNVGDMTKIDGEKYAGTVDLLVGGTPRQGFSVAGKQRGLDDERSGLAMAYVRLLETMRPRWFVWENVPGALSTNGGMDFKRFIEAIDAIGYHVAWRVLDAQYVRVDSFPGAVPQRRRRLFAVGHSGDWRHPAQVLFEPAGVLGNHPPIRRPWCGASSSSSENAGGSGKECAFWDGGQVSGTLTTRTHDNTRPEVGYCSIITETYPICLKNATRSPDKLPECKCIFSKDGSPAYTLDTAQPPAIAVCCQQNQRDEVRLTGGDGMVAGAITSETGGRNYNFVCYDNHAQDSRMRETGDVSPTISARSGTGGNNLPVVHCIAENIIGRKPENGGNGKGFQENLSYTLDTAGVHGVCSRSFARKLTPLECERLMGFPDNWTRISWRGKHPEECPDRHRYRACGNSMCVNVMRWIGKRIDMVDKGIDPNKM